MQNIIFGLLVAQIALAGATAEQPRKIEPDVELPIEERILQAFPDAPVMVEVARCESGLRHYLDDGGVIQGPTNDFGLFQIHKPSHEKKLKELGLDEKKLEDNIKFARYLYDHGGLSHWRASKHCWGKQN